MKNVIVLMTLNILYVTISVMDFDWAIVMEIVKEVSTI